MPDPTRVSLNYCARVLGVRWHRARKIVDRMAFAYPRGEDGLYDARILDLLRALRGQPHRELHEADRDWLAAYLKETHARQGTQGPGSARTDG